MGPISLGPSAGVAYLEHYPDRGGPPYRIPLGPFPFRIGRGARAQYVLAAPKVSKEHAEITCEDDQFRIRDLNSTNGTYVNGERITEAALNHGDIVYLADKELLFVLETNPGPEPNQPTEPASHGGGDSLAQATKRLRDLIDHRHIHVLFHPIVRLDTFVPIGYEALGRGNHPGLSPSPLNLFRLAETARLAEDLSRAFRQVTIKEAAGLPGKPLLFCNIHPSEVTAGSLLPSLAALPAEWRNTGRVVVEVHEEVVGDTALLRHLHEKIQALGLRIAYDDFGVGQSRLIELAEIPPDYVKLDRQLVQGIEQPGARREIIQSLARISQSLGFQIVAEGIETPEQAEACRALGCQLGQGFLFGQPQSAEAIRMAATSVFLLPAGRHEPEDVRLS
jgi:EAL domain-containing protein (putative c-di-GMP-specific phosphodiesterase class I)